MAGRPGVRVLTLGTGEGAKDLPEEAWEGGMGGASEPGLEELGVRHVPERKNIAERRNSTAKAWVHQGSLASVGTSEKLRGLKPGVFGARRLMRDEGGDVVQEDQPTMPRRGVRTLS